MIFVGDQNNTARSVTPSYLRQTPPILIGCRDINNNQLARKVKRIFVGDSTGHAKEAYFCISDDYLTLQSTEISPHVNLYYNRYWEKEYPETIDINYEKTKYGNGYTISFLYSDDFTEEDSKDIVTNKINNIYFMNKNLIDKLYISYSPNSASIEGLLEDGMITRETYINDNTINISELKFLFKDILLENSSTLRNLSVQDSFNGTLAANDSKVNITINCKNLVSSDLCDITYLIHQSFNVNNAGIINVAMENGIIQDTYNTNLDSSCIIQSFKCTTSCDYILIRCNNLYYDFLKTFDTRYSTPKSIDKHFSGLYNYDESVSYFLLNHQIYNLRSYYDSNNIDCLIYPYRYISEEDFNSQEFSKFRETSGGQEIVDELALRNPDISEEDIRGSMMIAGCQIHNDSDDHDIRIDLELFLENDFLEDKTSYDTIIGNITIN